jgi:hypothetical protein
VQVTQVPVSELRQDEGPAQAFGEMQSQGNRRQLQRLQENLVVASNPCTSM